jgi:hypothetical protein
MDDETGHKKCAVDNWEGPPEAAWNRDIKYIDVLLQKIKNTQLVYQSTTESESLRNKPTMATAIMAQSNNQPEKK